MAYALVTNHNSQNTYTCISCGKVQTMFLAATSVTRSVVIQTRVAARFWEWSNQSNSRQLISLFAARHADILQTWRYTCRETLIARAAARTRTLPRRPCRSRTIAHVDVVLLVAKCARHRYYESIILNFIMWAAERVQFWLWTKTFLSRINVK